ncbi:MAG: hypothetical protein ACI8P3_002360 [Saprospiraceae bacterium]|jgi:hypothetical protein
MSIKKSFLYLAIILIYSACGNETQTNSSTTNPLVVAQSFSNTFPLQEGDLLFQDNDCGPFCDAIEKVTHGINGANLSHVGIVIQGGNSEFVVLEAISRGVVETPIDTFLNRSFDKEGKPKVLVGRLKPAQQSLVRPAIQSALQHRGKAYDDVFDINNDKFYCSELIYFAFKNANEGTPIFQLRLMTYKDPDTKETFPIWADYFQKLNKSIPEDQPGLNPGSMSRSLYLNIVYAFGKPEGWRGTGN